MADGTGYIIKDCKLGGHGRKLVDCSRRLTELLAGDLSDRAGLFSFSQLLEDVIDEMGQLCSDALGSKFEPTNNEE